MSRGLPTFKDVASNHVNVICAQQCPAKLGVPTDNEHHRHLLPTDIHDFADVMGWIINLEFDSAAGGNPGSFIAITDSNVSTRPESNIIGAFGISMRGRDKARVGERSLVDSISIWPGSSGLAKWTALNDPGPLPQSTGFRKDLEISKIAVSLSRQLITISDRAFSHGA